MTIALEYNLMQTFSKQKKKWKLNGRKCAKQAFVWLRNRSIENPSLERIQCTFVFSFVWIFFYYYSIVAVYVISAFVTFHFDIFFLFFFCFWPFLSLSVVTKWQFLPMPLFLWNNNQCFFSLYIYMYLKHVSYSIPHRIHNTISDERQRDGRQEKWYKNKYHQRLKGNNNQTMAKPNDNIISIERTYRIIKTESIEWKNERTYERNENENENSGEHVLQKIEWSRNSNSKRTKNCFDIRWK